MKSRVCNRAKEQMKCIRTRRIKNVFSLLFGLLAHNNYHLKEARPILNMKFLHRAANIFIYVSLVSCIEGQSTKSPTISSTKAPILSTPSPTTLARHTLQQQPLHQQFSVTHAEIIPAITYVYVLLLTVRLFAFAKTLLNIMPIGMDASRF